MDDAVALQWKVYVEVSPHFCGRGREGLLELKKDSFVVKCDENDQDYVTAAYNEQEKNHQGIDKHDIQQEPRMYSQIRDSCQVVSFKFYVSILHNDCPAFFRGPTFVSMGMDNGITICLLA